MTLPSVSSIHDKLLKPTSFFGVKLWVAIIICIVAGFVLILSITLCWFLISRSRRRRRRDQKPVFSTKHVITSKNTSPSPGAMNKCLLSRNGWDIEMCIDTTPEKQVTHYNPRAAAVTAALPVRHQRTPSSFGKVYTLHEIEIATNWFADDSVMGSGDYGVVYRGYLFDHTRVAVKKLLANSARTKDLAAEVESLWCVRHKNLVKLLGYCTEGMFSLLVYEYVDNGNLNQWLHEKKCKLSPLTWKIRMGIIQGIAKGLAYLQEDCENAISHQHLKSSNILLDKQWNPKISDFGISKILGPDNKNGDLKTPLGMSGYIAPEYNSFFLDVKSDVFSFGVLVMEIVSGRTPVQYFPNEEIQEYLIDWMKNMVSEGRLDEVLDPRLPVMPSLVDLKRVVLIALRCVDPDASNRPKLGDVLHMLEPRDLLLNDAKATISFSRTETDLSTN